MMKSYRPISLLTSKVMELLLIKKLTPIVEAQSLIPDHQFRVVDAINKAFEEKKYCTAVFLDISQVFDKVWLNGKENAQTMNHKLCHRFTLRINKFQISEVLHLRKVFICQAS